MNRFVVILSLVLACCLPAIRCEAASPVLKFNPPNSVTFDVTSRTIRVSDRVTGGLAAETTSTVNACDLIKTDSGWLLGSTLKEMSVRPQPDSLQNSLSQLLIGIKTLLYINHDGKGIRMTGYEPLAARLDSLTPPKMHEMLRRVFSPANLSAKETNDWNLRHSGLIGRPVKVGREEHQQAPISFGPGQSWQVLILTRFEDTVRVGGRLCLKVGLYTDSDPRRLAASSGKSVADIGSIFGLNDSALSAMERPNESYHSRLTMLVEGETLLERSENSEREVILAVPGKDGKATVRRTQETVEKAILYH